MCFTQKYLLREFDENMFIHIQRVSGSCSTFSTSRYEVSSLGKHQSAVSVSDSGAELQFLFFCTSGTGHMRQEDV